MSAQSADCGKANQLREGRTAPNPGDGTIAHGDTAQPAESGIKENPQSSMHFVGCFLSLPQSTCHISLHQHCRIIRNSADVPSACEQRFHPTDIASNSVYPRGLRVPLARCAHRAA